MRLAGGVLALLLVVTPGRAEGPCPPGEGAAVTGPWGVTLCERPASVRVVMHDDPQAGVRVAAVTPGGILQTAGLTAGDVIYQVAGVRVTTAKAVLDVVGNGSRATGLTISFWRDGKPYLVRVWVPAP